MEPPCFAMAPPPARGAPARAAGHDERPGQGADVRPGSPGDRVHRARRDVGRRAGRRRARRSYPDTVPLDEQEATTPGPAQAPIEGSVTTLAPGGGVRVDGVTSQYRRVRRARGRRQRQGGRAGDADAAGGPRPLPAAPGGRRHHGAATSPPAASGELTGETMTTARLAAGTYRIEVHNWAGPAGNNVALKTTFFNSAGEPGT